MVSNEMLHSIGQALAYFLAMLFALTFHEAAHAFTAHLRGDDTAMRSGRLSLNPGVHADLVGTIILPLAGFLMHLPNIGWAKPVPVDERNLKNPVWDGFLVAVAGPISNFLMALIGTLAIRIYYRFGTSMVPFDNFLYPVIEALLILLTAFIFVNAALGLFNLIPLPPLDGASILRVLLPKEMYERYESIAGPYGFILLLMLAMGGGLSWIGTLSRAVVGICEVITGFIIPG